MTTLRAALQALPDATFADLLESDDAYLLVLDVPGVTEDTLEVTVAGGRLSIEGRRAKPGTEGYRYVEEQRDPGLAVDVPIPPDATAEAAAATVDRGVLEVRLPKRAAAVTEIEVGDA